MAPATEKEKRELIEQVLEHLTPPTGTPTAEHEEVTPPPRKKKSEISVTTLSWPTATVIGLLTFLIGGAVVWGQASKTLEETTKKADAATAALTTKVEKAQVDSIKADMAEADKAADLRLRVVENSAAANTSEHKALDGKIDDVKVQIADVKTQVVETNRKLDAMMALIKSARPQQ